MKKIFYVFLFIYSLATANAQHTTLYNGIKVKQGDLLFVGAKSENLSGAINRVTQQTDSAAFDHVGLIDIVEGIPYLLHASGSKGSTKDLLDSLTKRDMNRLYVVYRVGNDFQHAITEAVHKAHQMLGKPYNWTYVLNDSSYYCSDFIERAFRHVALFELEPMTFKNPNTDTFDDFWIQFYKRQGIPIPEGKLGCNPNGMAANKNIYKIGVLPIQK